MVRTARLDDEKDIAGLAIAIRSGLDALGISMER
jgi:hypothetical protein